MSTDRDVRSHKRETQKSYKGEEYNTLLTKENSVRHVETKDSKKSRTSETTAWHVAPELTNTTTKLEA